MRMELQPSFIYFWYFCSTGAAQLTSMLMRERDSDAPKLPLLLCESLFSVYLSVLIHALTFYETNVLYRLVAHEFTEHMWSTLFGGGLKTIVKPRSCSITDSESYFIVLLAPSFLQIFCCLHIGHTTPLFIWFYI